MQQEMTVVIVGHVDHGKSTLVGRLLYDSGQVNADKVDFARQRSAAQGRDLEFAFLLDGLEEEQVQGITIDFTQTRFHTAQREYIIADAPGHREFLKNMMSGASRADAALLLIDAEEGVREQSRRHGYILSLLGIRQLAVVVNKMDRVDWSQAVYEEIRQEYSEFLHTIGLKAQAFIPAAAYTGDNVLVRSRQSPWYQGPLVMEQLDGFVLEAEENRPLRLPVQDVYRFGQRRLLAGRLEAGILQAGQQVMLWPTEEQSSVKQIECWPDTQTDQVTAGHCVAVELADPLFVERGMLLTVVGQVAPLMGRYFHVRIVWLGKQPLQAGQRYKLKLGLQEMGAAIERFDRIMDIGELQDVTTGEVAAGYAAEGIICTDQPVVFEPFAVDPALGRFVLVDNYQIAGGGIVLQPVTDEERQAFTRIQRDSGSSRRPRQLVPTAGYISKQQRQERNGHRSFVVWLTGLSGSGKSTLARELEQRLFAAGRQVYVLDGDNIRGGLNRDLDFSALGRQENIRRIGEVAKLFVDAGYIVITAFISPYQRDRDAVRSLFAPGEFYETFVQCPLSVCESRDTKGFYQQARAGGIKDFTGVGDVYESPLKPELVVSTENCSLDECVMDILTKIE
ncbi:MAG TPA: adenylyl-sulfate kinase [Patescibacteria group bacterium]|nr:adenylyl-sulfate kinase [Patescibacteria group bacterium]